MSDSPLYEGFVQRVRNYVVGLESITPKTTVYTHLLAILDKLLRDLNELLHFFGHDEG